MKFTSALFGLLMGASLTTGAIAADSYTIDSRHTFPTFEINHLGFSTQRGRFNSASGKIMLVPSQNSGSIEVKIDTASIDMGLEAWDKHMRGEDFFNSEQFPAMTFKSTKLMFDGDKLVGAEGDFTLLGVTKHAAAALGLGDRGVLAPGMRCDLALFGIGRPAELCYWLGRNPCIGRVVSGA